jgi:hypothetical protein
LSESPPQSASVQCYSLRRVNPFLGLVAAVKTRDGRALSVDGRVWQIQILAHPPRGLWSRSGEREDVLQYFRFGVWSEADGLGRVPLNPILDVGHMVAASEELVDAVRAALPELPFPLAPELELWLLDQDRQLPLALLATALDDAGLDEVDVGEWNAGGRGGRPFSSPTLTSSGLAEHDASGRHRHAEALERLVRTAAGRRLNRQWFRRGAEGGGEGLAHGAPEGLAGRALPANAFPKLPLRTDWPDEEDGRLVADYIDWLAPYLLTLPALDLALRRRLEARAAASDALLVDGLWRLFPSVLDREALNRARVEAKLRRANA